MPDSRIRLGLSLELLRIREELLDLFDRIARRGLLDVAALVKRDFRQQSVRDGGPRARLGDVLVGREGVAMLDEEPGRLLRRAPAFRPHENPRALELLALKGELQVALRERRIHVGSLRCPRAPVPDHHRAAAVFAGRDDSFKGRVFPRVVLDVGGHAFDGRIDRRSLRNGPRKEHAGPFEPEVVVEGRRPVLLDDVGESPARRAALRGSLRSCGLLRHAEAALSAIFLEGHPPRRYGVERPVSSVMRVLA